MPEERDDDAAAMLQAEKGAETGGPSAPNPELIVDHLPLVRMIAGKLYRLRWGDAIGFDEYCQMGATGLVEAATRFDVSRGVPFGAYASSRITGAILNGLETATEQHQQIAARKRYAQERLASLAGEAPSSVPEPIEATLARLAAVAVGLAVGFMLEGSGMYNRGDESTAADGASNLALRQTKARLRRAIKELPEQERLVLEAHYFHHRSFVEIAESFGLTRGRISQVHRRAIERLRSRLAESDAAVFEA